MRTLVDLPAYPGGYHTLSIDGRDDRGAVLPSGTYFYRIESAGEVASGTATILK